MRNIIRIGVATAVTLGTLGGAAAIAHAATTGTTTVTATTGLPRAYETNVGPGVTLSSQPQAVVTSPALPVGNYLITYHIGMLIFPNGNVTCQTASSGAPNTLFALGGDGNTGSQASNGGVSGNGVVHIALSGETVSVMCYDNGAGTETGNNVIDAVRVGTLTENT
jgi:hypothetical protein